MHRAPRSPRTTLSDSQKPELRLKVATHLRSARKVISNIQGLINDASRGDRALSADAVVESSLKNFAAATGSALEDSTAGTLEAHASRRGK